MALADLLDADWNRPMTRREVMTMGFKKFGTGEVTETEGSLAKTASAEFTEADAEALRRENDAADTEED